MGDLIACPRRREKARQQRNQQRSRQQRSRNKGVGVVPLEEAGLVGPVATRTRGVKLACSTLCTCCS